MMWLVWALRATVLVGVAALLFPRSPSTLHEHPRRRVARVLFVVLIFGVLAGALGCLAAALHVGGGLVDVVILVALAFFVSRWPFGIRAPLREKLRLTRRGAWNAIDRLVQRAAPLDVGFCVAVLGLAIILGLASGLIHLLLTVAALLAAVGLVWKWPHSRHLPFRDKLRFAARDLWRDVRNRLR